MAHWRIESCILSVLSIALLLPAADRIAAPASLPLAFESNQGEAPPEVQFLARTPRLGVALERRRITLSLPAGTIEMAVTGAAPNTTVGAIEPLEGRANYFIGNQPDRWRRNIPMFAKVRYRRVYPGTDLVFYGNNRQLEYDFVIAPGADPRRIALKFTGSPPVTPRVEDDGSLLLYDGLRFRKPVAYQTPGDGRKVVRVDYVVREGGIVAFDIGAFDPAKTLVIDPVLSYSSFVGGSDDEGIFGIQRDSKGNVYIAGETSSVNFPTLNPIQPQVGGSYDAFISKFDPTGTKLIYSTYLGGANYDHAVGLVVDGAGKAHLAGVTYSSDFPVMNAIQPKLHGTSDGFVAVLDESGSKFVFSTYLGGNKADGVNDIAVDRNGGIFVTGSTSSTNYPVTSGAYQTTCDFGGVPGSCSNDGFVTKLRPSGTLSYSTYLGGKGYDAANGISVDLAGNAFITGVTLSSNFPLRNPFQKALAGNGNAFVTELNSAGAQLVFSTYLGGNATDSGQAIALDRAGNVYVTGTSTSTTFPLQNPYQAINKGGASDGFLTKFLPGGNALAYSTYFGGSGWDFPFRIAVDTLGDAVITGFTGSTDFPIVNAPQPAYAGGNTDAFVIRFTGTGSQPNLSTYLGGTGDEYGYSVHTDWAGNIWAGGSTSSVNFPTLNAFQGTYNGGPFDAFLSKYSDSPGRSLTVLEGGVSQLVAEGILSQDKAAPLFASLQTAEMDFASGDVAGSRNALRMFLAMVAGLKRTGALPQVYADSLMTAGAEILARL